MEPELMEEIDCGNLFDQIDDFIEFPSDHECDDDKLGSSSDYKDIPMWDDALQDCNPLLTSIFASDLAAELSVPYEDIVQLEWLSTFVEDSFSGDGLTLSKENLRTNNDPSSRIEFLTTSPVSVLESSSSSSSSSTDKTIPLSHGRQRARSKRPRPSTFNPRSAIHLVSPSSSSESDNFADSSSPAKKNTKKIKITLPANAAHDQPVRKCLHCEITKTPQWRAGPMGPKTLCNACGVRFKSGRLFPEYRPAASPTFVPALHSNSHKKVLEMRVKLETEVVVTASP